MSIEELFNKAKNLTISTINHLSNGLKSVKENVKQERLTICQNCDKFNSENITCNECGCFLQIKTSWASEKCPLNKWGIELSIDRQEDIPKSPESRVKIKSDCGCNKKIV